jgi:hypothetical protein
MTNEWTCGNSKHADLVIGNVGPTCRVCGEPRAVEPLTSKTNYSIADLDNLHALCEFAYEQGFHELGYDPVKVVADEIERLQSALQTILDFSDSAMRDGDGARDVARAALGNTALEPGAVGWQSIENVPKGMRVLVRGGDRNGTDGYHDVQAAWVDSIGNVWLDDRKEGSAPARPTHWMLLPNSPTTTEPASREASSAKLDKIREWADAWSKPPHADASEADRGWYWAAQEVQNILDPNPADAVKSGGPHEG